MPESGVCGRDLGDRCKCRHLHIEDISSVGIEKSDKCPHAPTRAWGNEAPAKGTEKDQLEREKENPERGAQAVKWRLYFEEESN